MKYENFEKAQILVEQINEQVKRLSLFDKNPNIIIEDRYNIHKDYKVHTQVLNPEDMEVLAKAFIAELIKNATNRILTYKIELDKL